jgi:hypothetical protein
VVQLTSFVESGYAVQFTGGGERVILHDSHADIVVLTFKSFSGALVITVSGGNTFIYE